MNITSQQTQYVKHMLLQNIRYKETYDEVLDHILSAIEQHSETEQPFDAVLHSVINEAFGGMEELKELEKERADLLMMQILKRYMASFTSYFKTPYIWLLYGCLVYAFYESSISSIIVLIPYIIGLLPALFVTVRYVLRVADKNIKPSVKDSGINRMALFMAIFYGYQVVKTLTETHAPQTMEITSAVIFSTVFMIPVVLLLSFIKVYRQELQMQLV